MHQSFIYYTYDIRSPWWHHTFRILAHNLGGVYFQQCYIAHLVSSSTIKASFAQSCSSNFDSTSSSQLYHAIPYCNYSSYRAYMKTNYWAGYIPLSHPNHTKTCTLHPTSNLCVKLNLRILAQLFRTTGICCLFWEPYRNNVWKL